MSEAVRVELPKKVAQLLREEAAKRGLSLEELTLEKLLSALDPMARAEAYLELHERYLAEARELAGKGELAQAGEKLWGAVTALLNAIGELRGLPHYSHRDYSDLVEIVASEQEMPELGKFFAVAERLHANFYHNFIRDPKVFEAYEEDVLKLVETLKNLIRAELGEVGPA